MEKMTNSWADPIESVCFERDVLMFCAKQKQLKLFPKSRVWIWVCLVFGLFLFSFLNGYECYVDCLINKWLCKPAFGNIRKKQHCVQEDVNLNLYLGYKKPNFVLRNSLCNSCLFLHIWDKAIHPGTDLHHCLLILQKPHGHLLV